MSLARGSQNGGHYYSNITMPQVVNVQFTVASTDTGGLGLTGLKSNGWVHLAFMHTTQTAGVTSGITNPNPASGVAMVQLKQNFNAFLGLEYTLQAPVTGGALTSTTNHTSYQISALGTTTTAQWVAVGLPSGVTPAVGVSFVATASQSIGGTGSVKLIGNSGIMSLEVFGSSALSNNTNIASNGGQYVLIQFLNTSSALVAPTDGTIVSLEFIFDRSSVSIDGL